MLNKQIKVLAASITVFIPIIANAHDIWDNGVPVPIWIKAECCGIHDAHHLRMDQVHLTRNGYMVDGYPNVISTTKLLPFRDGEWWVFYRETDEGMFSDISCFFGPATF